MKQYTRKPLTVAAQKYVTGKGMEDGFRLYSQVITNEGIETDHLIRLEREDGTVVCPYVRNRRGLVYIKEGDYIICEEGENGGIDKHVCGEDKFNKRFEAVTENL